MLSMRDFVIVQLHGGVVYEGVVHTLHHGVSGREVGGAGGMDGEDGGGGEHLGRDAATVGVGDWRVRVFVSAHGRLRTLSWRNCDLSLRQNNKIVPTVNLKSWAANVQLSLFFNRYQS